MTLWTVANGFDDCLKAAESVVDMCPGQTDFPALVNLCVAARNAQMETLPFLSKPWPNDAADQMQKVRVARVTLGSRMNEFKKSKISDKPAIMLQVKPTADKIDATTKGYKEATLEAYQTTLKSFHNEIMTLTSVDIDVKWHSKFAPGVSWEKLSVDAKTDFSGIDVTASEKALDGYNETLQNIKQAHEAAGDMEASVKGIESETKFYNRAVVFVSVVKIMNTLTSTDDKAKQRKAVQAAVRKIRNAGFPEREELHPVAYLKARDALVG